MKPVGRPRERKPREPETDTQRIFLRRVKEEMGDLSVAGLAKRAGVNQKALNNILADGAVPKLTAIHKIALALGKHVWELFRESEKQAILTGKVTNLHPKPPRLLGPQPRDRAETPMQKRNKSKG